MKRIEELLGFEYLNCVRHWFVAPQAAVRAGGCVVQRA
jgi:hypothetical protein